MDMEVQIRKKLGSFCLDIQFQPQAARIGILGASGCGKSMALRSIAGIETPDAGYIRVAGRVLFDSKAKRDVKPQKRGIGYLFQNYALFPTMTAAQNIAAGMRGTRAEKKRRAEEMIVKFHLDGLAGRLPSELSGGQQQRVALARIMASQPEVILLDEPFSALDVFLKDQLQRELAGMLADYPGIIILVSHSRDEIYRFCQELLIMDQGKNVIYGKTQGIFDNPVYREAARLTGCKNFSKIKMADAHTLEASDWGITLHVKQAVPAQASSIGYRAHDFIPAWGSRPQNSLRVTTAQTAQLPFEQNFYLVPEGAAAQRGEVICWFAQRDTLPQIRQKGMPDYLVLQEEKMMFLQDAGHGANVAAYGKK